MNIELEQKVIQGLEAHLQNWDTKDTEKWLKGCAACPYGELPRTIGSADSCVYVLFNNCLRVLKNRQLKEIITMSDNRYNVLCDGVVIAENLVLEYALLFVQAFLEKYFAEPSLKITIERVSKEARE